MLPRAFLQSRQATRATQLDEYKHIYTISICMCIYVSLYFAHACVQQAAHLLIFSLSAPCSYSTSECTPGILSIWREAKCDHWLPALCVHLRSSAHFAVCTGKPVKEWVAGGFYNIWMANACKNGWPLLSNMRRPILLILAEHMPHVLKAAQYCASDNHHP